MKRFEVIMSCMYQQDMSVIELSNLSKVQTLIINQTNEGKSVNTKTSSRSRMICTVDRGLSKSRNMAIKNASADFCLIADDDEYFFDDLESKVVSTFDQHQEVDVMIFKISNIISRQKNKYYRLKRLDCLRVSSVQIAFRLESIRNKIWFDEKLGAGTINGSWEENKFLLDCFDQGLNISYIPIEIGLLRESKSSWFEGYDKNYFYTHGKVSRYTLGLPLTLLYNLYYVMSKHSLYKINIGMFNALKYSLIGSFTKDVNKVLKIGNSRKGKR